MKHDPKWILYCAANTKGIKLSMNGKTIFLDELQESGYTYGNKRRMLFAFDAPWAWDLALGKQPGASIQFMDDYNKPFMEATDLDIYRLEKHGDRVIVYALFLKWEVV